MVSPGRARLGALPGRALGLRAAVGLDLGGRRTVGVRPIPLRPLDRAARPLGLDPGIRSRPLRALPGVRPRAGDVPRHWHRRWHRCRPDRLGAAWPAGALPALVPGLATLSWGGQRASNDRRRERHQFPQPAGGDHGACERDDVVQPDPRVRAADRGAGLGHRAAVDRIASGAAHRDHRRRDTSGGAATAFGATGRRFRARPRPSGRAAHGHCAGAGFAPAGARPIDRRADRAASGDA